MTVVTVVLGPAYGEHRLLVHVDDLVLLLMDGVAVALVSFADTSVPSRTYAARLRTRVDPNQEMVGLGVPNLELFHERLLDAIANSPTPVRWLVVAAEPVASVDVTAADAACELDDTLHDAGIELCFAEMKDPVKDKLKRFGFFTPSATKPSLRPSAKR